MAATSDRKIVGVDTSVLYPQADATFTETEPGEWDTGQRVFLTLASTPKRLWPQPRQRDTEHPKMFVRTVTDRLDASGLVELTVTFKGSLKEGKIPRYLHGCSTQMFNLPALNGDAKANIIAPVPLPTLTRSYIAWEQPTNAGVASGAAGDFLPTPPSFSISFVPDPDAPATLNYITGWVLQSRQWEDTGLGIWAVTEVYVYYYNIAI